MSYMVGSHGGLHPGVYGGGVQGQATPAADADQADFLRIHILPGGQAVDSGLKILGVDVREAM